MRKTCLARFVVMLMVCALGIGAAQAKTTALLIGVSDYDTPGIADLRGPKNDVRLMRDVLSARGISDIRILADGIPGAKRPVRAAIMAALAKLAEDAKDGDFFIVQMSGHGTRQPDINGDEGDGYDEVFLPADVSPTQTGGLAIPNAIVDDEIGAAILAIRKKGADVWFILDACHSGTGLRAGAFNTADRYVDPAILGLPDVPQNIENKGDEAIVANGAKPAGVKGRLIAFYSAQSDELAREVDFGAGKTSANQTGTENNWYGLFTAKLANRLQSAGAISYRQLFQSVVADMNSTSVPGSARLQTPFWEGTLIDAAVLGGSKTIGLRQYLVKGDALSAGLVHGLTKGTVVELVADAAAGKKDVLGFAQIEEVKATSSFIRPIADDCAPSATSLCAVKGQLPEKALFARILVVPVDTKVRLSAILVRSTTGPTQTPEYLSADDQLAISLNKAIEEVNVASGTHFEINQNNYDIEVSAYKGKLWFGRSTITQGEPLGLAWQPEQGELTKVLARIAYAERFAAILTSISDSGSVLNMSPVNITATLKRSDIKLLSKPGSPLDPARECGKMMRRDAYSPEGELPRSAEIKQCDIIRMAVQGEIPGMRDVNRIHIDSNFCVSAEYTRIEDNRTRVPLGRGMMMCSDCPGGYSAGDERVFVIVSEARKNQDQLNLSGVVDNCSASNQTRGAQSQPLSNFLKTLGKKPGTRGFMGGFAVENAWVKKFTWRILPRAIAMKKSSN